MPNEGETDMVAQSYQQLDVHNAAYYTSPNNKVCMVSATTMITLRITTTTSTTTSARTTT